jgi:hypothetical protein
MVWNRPIPGVAKVENQSVPVVSPAGQKPKIMIGVPHTSQVTMEWAFKTLVPLCTTANWCTKVFQFARGVPQSVARDHIVEAALADKEVTHIMWVDTDSVPENPKDVNEAIRALYERNEPIVSGLYRAKQREGFNYAAWVDAHQETLGFMPFKEWTGNWLQVDVVGMGFCLVKREVYEKLPKPWYPWPTQSPSEDFNFCIAARKAGYKINLFTEVKIRHLGELGVNTDGTITTLEV